MHATFSLLTSGVKWEQREFGSCLFRVYPLRPGRVAEKWDTNPLVGPNVFLSRPGEGELAEATSDLAAIAADEASASDGSPAASVFQELRSKKITGHRD